MLQCAFLLSSIWDGAAQIAATFSPLEDNIISVSPSAIFNDPGRLMDIWVDEPVPIAFYSEEEIALQTKINETVSDWIVTYSPVDQTKEWLDIDFEEITPYTWKWIYFNLPKNDGSVTKISLRRPNWWVRKAQAGVIGNNVYLDLPEMGVQGWATVLSIVPSRIDTRLWKERREGDYVIRPVTAKFVRESDDVYTIYLESTSEFLGVTGSHPIWSLSRNGWVQASTLVPGESVKTHSGKAFVSRIEKLEGLHKVYNLEIYRDHNFFASLNAVAVHNGCLLWDNEWISVLSMRRSMIDLGEDLSQDGFPPLLISWAGEKMESGVAKYFIDRTRGNVHLATIIDFFSRKAAYEGALQVEIRLSKNATSKLVDKVTSKSKIPKDGTRIGKFVTTYDSETGTLQLSNVEGDYNGFSSGID